MWSVVCNDLATKTRFELLFFQPDKTRPLLSQKDGCLEGKTKQKFKNVQVKWPKRYLGRVPITPDVSSAAMGMHQPTQNIYLYLCLRRQCARYREEVAVRARWSLWGVLITSDHLATTATSSLQARYRLRHRYKYIFSVGWCISITADETSGVMGTRPQTLAT